MSIDTHDLLCIPTMKPGAIFIFILFASDPEITPQLVGLGTGSSSQEKDSWLILQPGAWPPPGCWSRRSHDYRTCSKDKVWSGVVD